jgi:restriction endonuclease S subunit
LEGLEISEELFSYMYSKKRLDSNFAAHPQRDWLSKIQEANDILLLKDSVKYISSGHTPYLHDVKSNGDIDFLTVECVDNLKINYNAIKRIKKSHFEKEFLKNRIVKNSIVCTIKRRICNAFPFLEDNYKMAFNQDISFFLPNEDINAAYLAVYLNSKVGKTFANRQMTEQMNPYISVSNLSTLPIVILDSKFQIKIEEIFRQATSQSEQSIYKYTQAETLLLETLGLKDFEPSKEPVNIKSFKESFGASGRLDAEYYQKKYEFIERAIRNYINGYAEFDHFIDNYSTGFPFKSETYITSGGIPLIRINNVNKGILDISNAINIPGADIDLSPKDIAIENDILISMSGTIGNSCKIPKGVRAVINQRIMRITPKNFDNEVLPLIINSPIGEFQLNRIGTGAVQTNISSTDIRKILIPKLTTSIQTELSKKINESFQLKTQSEQLLELAKTAVEKAIEENEEEAMLYIKAKLKELN